MTVLVVLTGPWGLAAALAVLVAVMAVNWPILSFLRSRGLDPGSLSHPGLGCVLGCLFPWIGVVVVGIIVALIWGGQAQVQLP